MRSVGGSHLIMTNYSETLEHIDQLIRNSGVSEFDRNLSIFDKELQDGNIPKAIDELKRWITILEKLDPEKAAVVSNLMNKVLFNYPIRYMVVSSQDELRLIFDKLVECCRKMISKTGEHGLTCEILVKQIINSVGSDTCYLLVGMDQKGEIAGFLFALQIDNWVEVPALWSKPGVARLLRWEAFDLLKQWARSHGTTKILACVTRSPDKFYPFFYEPLGFKKVGYLMEVKL